MKSVFFMMKSWFFKMKYFFSFFVNECFERNSMGENLHSCCPQTYQSFKLNLNLQSEISLEFHDFSRSKKAFFTTSVKCEIFSYSDEFFETKSTGVVSHRVLSSPSFVWRRES